MAEKPSNSEKAKLATARLANRRPHIDVKRVELQPPGSAERTSDEDLWDTIRQRTTDLNFKRYEEFIDRIFSDNAPNSDEREALAKRGVEPGKLARCFHGTEAYKLLQASTEVFVSLQCGVPPMQLAGASSSRVLPYLQRILDALKLEPADSPLSEGIFRPVAQDEDFDPCYPCLLELIWSYWHEEGMLVQSLNAICMRFQNKRVRDGLDPLANLRLNPLRPLNTLLWGYIQDEVNRLTVARRAYEYEHEYGLRLVGKAVANMQSVDRRTKFIEAFHNLLYVTSRFYKEADDTTVQADAFPVLNALRELHLILAQGAHNQFGDLPWTARVEMLIQKWLLSRNEIREFLGGAPMVPYKEPWMSNVDAMKTAFGWSDVSVSHYRDLGVYGEQILLSVRWNDWIDDAFTQANAYNWAEEWRAEIQSYIHSYRAVTGIDLSAEVTDTGVAAQRYIQPSIHVARRLQMQRNGAPESNGFYEGGARRGDIPGPSSRMGAAARNGHVAY